MYQPGTRFHYTTFHTVLLGAVMASVAEKPYLELMQEEVFTPSEMSATIPAPVRGDDKNGSVEFRVGIPPFACEGGLGGDASEARRSLTNNRSRSRVCPAVAFSMIRLVVARKMIVPNYHVQRQRARRLRKKMTDAEVKLWQRLRGKQLRQVQFYRQRPLGPFIADFWAPAIGLVIEVDGSQHLDEAGRRYDTRRDAWFRHHGIRVIRYDNLQILTETEAVLEHLLAVIDSLRSHPP